MTWKKIIRSVLRWDKEDKNAGRDPYIDMACSTHTGNVRAHNEDNFSFDEIFMDEEHQSLDRILCMRQPVSRNPAAALFDGMGGESAGEKASYAAARTFTQLCDEESWDQERLSRVIHRMNEAVCREKLSGRYESMGCTAAVIAFSDGQMLCANLGDSPVFLFRDRRLIQLSVHHTNEALLRERGITGRKPGLTQFLGIEEELQHNIDKHSKAIIAANIEVLLNHCLRFYDRQFVTRKVINKDVLIRFENLLSNYFESGKAQQTGLPTVAYCADQLHFSPNYFGDLIKKETGKSAIEYIHLAIIEKVKDQLAETNKTISEIAYETGFQYPHHLSRMFKKVTGCNPNEYRAQNAFQESV